MLTKEPSQEMACPHVLKEASVWCSPQVVKGSVALRITASLGYLALGEKWVTELWNQ